MSRPAVIAIDGPAGSGKSTVARAVAEAVGLPMLETGAMYRALTWAVLQAGADPADGEAVTAVARRVDIQADRTVRVDDVDVTESVRSPAVTASVSAVAAHPGAREVLVAAQRAWLRAHGGGVAEGRDIGSVVAPDAVLKVYLEASAETRAERRVAQEGERAGNVDEVLADIRRRDGLDTTRAASPLVIPDDAVVIDTTGRSVEQVVADIVERYREVVPAPPAPAASEPRPAPAKATAPALPEPPGRGELIFYAFCRSIVVGLARVLWRLRVVHGDRVPRQGAYVLAPSHRSILDTPFLGAVTRRRIRFMGKAELWAKGGLGARFLSGLGGFPVDRGVADRAALRSAMAAVEGGEPLAVFPEGTRRHGPLIEDLHDGVAYVAARVGVPIVPVGIGGSEEILAKGRKLPRFKKVVLVVGKPIEPPRREGSVRRSDVAALTEQLRAELQQLFDEAQALS